MPSKRKALTFGLAVGGWCVAAAQIVAAQTPSAEPRRRPSCRLSLDTHSSFTGSDEAQTVSFHEVMTSVSCQMPELDDDGVDYGADFRISESASPVRPDRVSVYEGFVGARLNGGAVRVRVGHLSLSDVGGLGSVAGGSVEVRQRPESASRIGRMRVVAFGGLEPLIYETGYAPDVRKVGGFVAFDGERARRHVAGFVAIRDGGIAERSVLTTTHFMPIGPRLFVYQAMEYDVRPPVGYGHQGVTYSLTTARVSPTDRFDLQGTYHRGRSVDTRGLGDDVLHGRPITQAALDGLLYESGGGRVNVNFRRARVYAGYSRDRTNQQDGATGRVMVGGHAGNVAGSGFDLSGSDSIMDGAAGRFHAQYVSVGRQIGSTYLSGDYATSLSVVRYTRWSGLTVEQRPRTTRLTGNAVVYLGRSLSLHATIDRSTSDQVRDLRILSGITYRLR